MIIGRAVATMRAMEAIQEILRRALDALRGGDQAQAARLSDQVLQAEDGCDFDFLRKKPRRSDPI